MKRVIGIVRVSTAGQVGEDKYGVERQHADIRLAAKAHDLEVIRTIEVVESGGTAFHGEAFQQVFKDLERPDIAGAVVSATDRLIRPGCLGDLQVFDPFQHHGKLLFTPAQVIDVRTDGGYLMAGMFGMSAGLEKRAILNRTLSGKERARVAAKHPGGGHILPRGLEYVRERDEHGHVVKSFWRYTEDAAKVKRCYDLLFAGVSFEEIAERVGIPTGRGVAYLLRNTCWKAIRTYAPNGLRTVPMEKPMGIEPLIDPERWAKAQTILDAKRTKWRARTRPRHDISLCLGLLRCRCSRPLYLKRDYRPGQHDVFICASGHTSNGVKGVSCGAPSIRRIVADAAVMDAIVRFGDAKTVRVLMEQAMTKPAGKKPPSAANTQREIARVTAERERLIDMRVKDRITEEQFDARDRKLAAERRDLEAQLPKPEPVIDPKIMGSAIASLFAEFPFLTLEEQSALARRTFIAFDMTDDGGVGAATMRGETLGQIYANNRRLSSPSSIACC